MSKAALSQLSENDIRMLVRHPDNEMRAMAAQRLCRTVRGAELSEGEREIAGELLTYMAKDAAAIVRRALAVTLKNSPKLPHDVAVMLAKDIDSIAVPVLNFSPVFNDDDLIEVLRSKAAAKVAAIARRPSVSGGLVNEIIRFGDSKAVAVLAANDGADISPDQAGEMLARYRSNDLIAEAFIRRRDLPTAIIERLITHISEEAALVLTRKHAVPVDIAIDLANRSRERATIDLIDQSFRTRDLALFVARLKDEGRLTPTLILRAAGCARMRFVEHGLAALAGIRVSKAALMVHDAGPFGLKALCARAGLTDAQAKFVHASAVIFRDLEMSGISYDAEYFQEMMILRVLTLPLKLSDADQIYFLEKLDGLGEGDIFNEGWG
ncbi:DUF2336 domain-containing protein [Fretibacter rubidus]|uniref:DUF2336 domain-containing protein n=1 Tax=Fretibacter rubidus TaxID=570162 RepID=UPI00352A1850